MQLYENYIFPRFFDSILKHQGFEPTRALALAKVRGRILEIGIGTGLNLDFYPPWVKQIDAIEPNPGMRERLQKRAENHRVHVRCTSGVAESIPFPNRSFDTVVSTFTLCTVQDIPAALQEIRRVLAPGGRFLFMEHGLSDDWLTAKTQRFLNPIQNIIGCGCKLTVDVEAQLKGANFLLEDFQKASLGTGPKFLGFIYSGLGFPKIDNLC